MATMAKAGEWRREGSLTGKLLVAMPSLRDPHFERAVVFVCAHTEEGALGLVVNRLHPASMLEVVHQLDLEWNRDDLPDVLAGGPVGSERGFILYRSPLDFPGHLEVSPGLFMGTNPDILRHLARFEESGPFLFALGYAGWGVGQLENELRENAWLVVEPDLDLLFDLPLDERWESALRRLGIDPFRLVDAGHGMIN
ncbi:MAG: YqgE/AlgH family protein [Magnetococcales bacterium]|nr:YqgE/AlgH family protein [Magnetococcales bacterium]